MGGRRLHLRIRPVLRLIPGSDPGAAAGTPDPLPEELKQVLDEAAGRGERTSAKTRGILARMSRRGRQLKSAVVWAFLHEQTKS